ncbi:GH39 family glycosyl hydrolase [Dyadobacter aurulentus]|uniref:GH39 family glycosyl hydrolase n=1 Tax=Dyadobacter sp. UC 10 TaxID=2605428 RepID=UPI0011F303F2|nr:beta-xylosidase [Dyadobacter sp. UC 10]KAA0991993.1 beta-xylosidase [Dyadobacter sp. UC 10]
MKNLFWKTGIITAFVAAVVSASAFAQDKSAEKPAVVEVDFGKTVGPMKPVWAWFGYDEPNYTYMKEGKKLLSEIADLSPVPVYVRAHCLLCTGDGTAALKWGSTNAYTEDENGKPVYNWAIVDSIFDTYVQRGMKPLAQIGFMPKALSVNPEPYQHDWKPGDPYNKIMTGWAYPPKDYQKWADLVYNWVKHSVERYGQKEVESWYWEVWNEPNGYWKGTMEEFFKLYDYSADAVKRALPTARIGGLNIAGTSSPGGKKWLEAFLLHCAEGTNYVTGKKGAPLDAVLFHAKGSPKLINGVVRMNMSPQLRDIQTGFKSVLAYPQFKNLPLIVGESDPEGCAACGMATNPSNAYRNGTMYSSYTAATFARKYALADEYQINFLGAVSWSFEFENQPWFYGFRDLATNGVDKPVLNVFRMFGKMSGSRVEVKSSRMYPLQMVLDSSIRGEQTEIGALASKDGNSAAVMLWNYHDDDLQGVAEPVKLILNSLNSKKIKITEYRIDREHSNSYEAWKKMGSPQSPDKTQIAALEKAGKLEKMEKAPAVESQNGKTTVRLALPRQAVSLLTIEW